ncbi:hypothetical protein MRX96_032048 [Rhipicephalus microplus]
MAGSPATYKTVLLGKATTATATKEHQQPQASETNKAKAATWEVSWRQSPGQLNSPKTSPRSTSRPPPPLNNKSDPFP